jgi:peptidyl-prolyl cis-trans isomerase D
MLGFMRSGGKRTKVILWAVAIVTIVTFVGGFIFIFGAGLDSTRNARATGAVAVVNGQRISNVDFQNALVQQREAYRKQYGVDPADRDLRMIEMQTWRTLVSEHLVTEEAKRLGLNATDKDVSLAMRTNPPQVLMTVPDFQTNGQFDPNKYRAALANPNYNWAPFEELARRDAPMRKLEERLLASIKVTDAELRQLFHDRNDKVNATVVAVQPAPDLKVTAPTEAELKATYEAFKGRFSSGTRVQLEVMRVEKKYGDEELRLARETAQSLVNRIRGGEKFEDLARDFSEGPNAAQGGLVPQPIAPQQLGPDIGPKVMALPVGGILDPIQDAGRFVVIKLVDRTGPTPNGPPMLRIAQIIVKAKPNDTSMRKQVEELKKIRGAAMSSRSLAQAASAKGQSTFKTQYYDYNGPPTELFTVPEAAEWGLGAKTGDISPVFDGIDEFVIAQVAARHEGGPAPQAEIVEPVRQIAEMGRKVDTVKAKADAVAQAVASGRSLEDAARAQGLEAMRLAGMSRATPDPRLAGAPEAVGALFMAAPGKVVGPVRALNGWYFVRLDGVTAAADTTFEREKSTLAREILQRRQQTFFNGLMTSLRSKAKVQDLRTNAME